MNASKQMMHAGPRKSKTRPILRLVPVPSTSSVSSTSSASGKRKQPSAPSKDSEPSKEHNKTSSQATIAEDNDDCFFFVAKKKPVVPKFNFKPPTREVIVLNNEALTMTFDSSAIFV
jgi:hypothetical protein